MAGKYGSASGWLLVDGYNVTGTGKLTGLTIKIEAAQEDTTGLGDSWSEATPTGLNKVTITQAGGFFDTTDNSSHESLRSQPSGPQATQRIVCLGFGGQTIGEPFLGIQGAYTHEYEVLGTNGELTKAHAAHTCSGQVDKGEIIQHLTAKTADWNTKTLSTTVDYTTSPHNRTMAISNISVANPTSITTVGAHGLTSGQKVVISGSDSTPTVNGSRTATVTSSTTFTTPVNVTVQGTTGSLVYEDTPNGAAGYQQVVAFSGFSGFVGKLRDAPDDVTYADLITFANVTGAPAVERATVAGTVDRYMSYDGNVTGSGSITVFAGIARG